MLIVAKQTIEFVPFFRIKSLKVIGTASTSQQAASIATKEISIANGDMTIENDVRIMDHVLELAMSDEGLIYYVGGPEPITGEDEYEYRLYIRDTEIVPEVVS